MISEERLEKIQTELAAICGELSGVADLLDRDRILYLTQQVGINHILDYMRSKDEAFLCKAIEALSPADQLEEWKQAWCMKDGDPNGREWHG